jgi:predicted nucleic acid-binding protein
MTAAADTKVIVDTNIFVYCFDMDEGEKHERAKQFVATLFRGGQLLLTVQILHEFYSTVTHPKKQIKLSHDAAAHYIQQLVGASQVVSLELSMTLSALDAVKKHGLSFWDALIWAAAKEHQVPVIYTEDFQHNREIDGVRFINPFVSA